MLVQTYNRKMKINTHKNVNIHEYEHIQLNSMVYTKILLLVTFKPGSKWQNTISITNILVVKFIFKLNHT